MKLDEKIKNKLMICDCYETIEAEKYLGKNGYFTNNFPDFADLSKTTYGTLTQVATNNYSEKPYYDDNNIYAYFLPEEYVRQEKVFRPCTLDDFSLHIGDLIKFRRKDNHNFEIGTMYMGYIKNSGVVRVLLGNNYYSLKELFECYEWYDSDSDTWEMFGVEE